MAGKSPLACRKRGGRRICCHGFVCPLQWMPWYLVLLALARKYLYLLYSTVPASWYFIGCGAESTEKERKNCGKLPQKSFFRDLWDCVGDERGVDHTCVPHGAGSASHSNWADSCYCFSSVYNLQNQCSSDKTETNKGNNTRPGIEYDSACGCSGVCSCLAEHADHCCGWQYFPEVVSACRNFERRNTPAYFGNIRDMVCASSRIMSKKLLTNINSILPVRTNASGRAFLRSQKFYRIDGPFLPISGA